MRGRGAHLAPQQSGVGRIHENSIVKIPGEGTGSPVIGLQADRQELTEGSDLGAGIGTGRKHRHEEATHRVQVPDMPPRPNRSQEEKGPT
nr:MAG TPA: hypothetical protein [Caudoviricetes sp.]